MPDRPQFAPRRAAPLGRIFAARGRSGGVWKGFARVWLALFLVFFGVFGTSRAQAAEIGLPEAPAGYATFSSDWLELAYAPSLRGKVEVLKQVAGPTRDEFRSLLGDDALKKVFVRVAGTPDEMKKLAPEGAPFPSYASGVAYPKLGLVLLSATPRFPGESFELAQVFRHELLHIALHDAVSDRAPRWFDEGLAVHLSGELYMDRLTTLATASLTKRLLPLRDLTYRFPSGEADATVAYAEAADLVRYLLRGDDEARFSLLLERMREGDTFEKALDTAYSLSLADLETEWQKDVASRYTFWPVLFGSSTIWGVAFVLLGLGYVRKRRQMKEKLSRWEREEAIEDARLVLVRRALEARPEVRLITSAGTVSIQDKSTQEKSDEEGALEAHPAVSQPFAFGGVPRVEHEGRWHTLH